MKTRFCLSLAALALFASWAHAGDFYPLPSTNAIVLNFASEIPESIKDSISRDYQSCIMASVSDIELYHRDRDPSNHVSLAGFWQPYEETSVITNRLGFYLPTEGVYSNGILTIDISYTFATNFQHQIDSTAAYSNEIAAAYTFIESLSPTNLQTMSANELLSMELWKQAPPGQTPIPQKQLASAVNIDRQTVYFPPPRVAFHVWDCGPTNNPPYLWCRAPIINQWNRVDYRAMIYFQNQWWFTQWYCFPEEQQW